MSYIAYQFGIKSLLCFPWLVFFLRTQTLFWHTPKNEKVFSYSLIKSFFCSQKCEFLFSEPVSIAATTLLLLVYKVETSEQMVCTEWITVYSYAKIHKWILKLLFWGMSDVGCSLLGAGAWGWPREMLWGGREVGGGFMFGNACKNLRF